MTFFAWKEALYNSKKTLGMGANFSPHAIFPKLQEGLLALLTLGSCWEFFPIVLQDLLAIPCP